MTFVFDEYELKEYAESTVVVLTDPQQQAT